MKKYSNIFYQQHIAQIGGVETFLYELARKYQDRDLTIIYSSGNKEQIKRLRKYVRCIKYDGKPIKCDRAFFNYSTKIIDNIEANEYIQIIHADFGEGRDKSVKNLEPITSSKIQKYYAVSANNAISFSKVTGKEVGIAYNPIYIEKEPRIMRLIAPQRLSQEKGGKRLEKLVTELDKAGIFYELTIFSNDTLSISSPNVIYRKPTLDIRKYIANSDYLVLLSDTEGFSYGLYESLSLGVPVIVTKLPVLEEIGVNTNNGFILEFDMSNLNVEEIYKKAGKFKFEYKQKADIWNDLLTNKKSTYKEEKDMKYLVRATNKYERNDISDVILSEREGKRIVPKEGQEWEVDLDRMESMVADGMGILVKKIPDIEDTQLVIKGEEIKEEATDTNVDTIDDEIEIIEDDDVYIKIEHDEEGNPVDFETMTLESMTREQLFTLAELLEIKVAKNISTANLIKKIKEKQNS